MPGEWFGSHLGVLIYGGLMTLDPINHRAQSHRQRNGRFLFLQQFLRHPQQIASVTPSSRFLERRLIETAALADARLVVEFGPGAGGTTRAMLRVLPERSRLVVIEVNADFVSLLQSVPDPRLLVHHGSAAELCEALDQHGLARPDVVVSGIPFSTIPRSVGRDILQAVWASLAPGGRFVSYQWRSRVAVLARDILGEPEVGVELRNVPPMRLYCWRKPAILPVATPVRANPRTMQTDP